MGYFREYCTGCGLCENNGYSIMEFESDGFSYPKFQSEKMADFCEKICPMAKNYLKRFTSEELWGKYKGYYTGFSNNKYIRYHASSGGVLTSVCLYLLSSGKIDAVIQTKGTPKAPTETITVVSETEEAVINCSGSRYSVSSPLREIDSIIDSKKKYAFVGKPCDVSALRNYSEINPVVKQSIKYYFSFFCAGTPSRVANEELLKSLGCPSNNCVSLQYRGNGWPGYVMATDDTDKIYKMEYQEAWMKILGREIRLSCKFCIDSIGERSDISCGDHWYIKNGKPVFTENDGINCIFSWTKKGENLLQEMAEHKMITVHKGNIDILKLVQPNHYYRRTTILYKWLGFKLFFRETPHIPYKNMIKLQKNIGIKSKLGCLKGTVIRIINKRI